MGSAGVVYPGGYTMATYGHGGSSASGSMDLTHPLGSHGRIRHPTLGLVNYSVREVSDDPDTQVAQVIGMMRAYATADAGNQLLRADAAHAYQSTDPLDDTFRWIKSRMKFVRDEATASQFGNCLGHWRPVAEALIRPADQVRLEQPQGDCDDYCMYGASHLLARGVPCSYCTVAADDADPSMYSHVYLTAYPASGRYQGMRVPLDLSHGPYVGWETGNRFGKRAEWPVSNEVRAIELAMLGLVGAGVWFAWQAYKRGM